MCLGHRHQPSKAYETENEKQYGRCYVTTDLVGGLTEPPLSRVIITIRMNDCITLIP